MNLIQLKVTPGKLAVLIRAVDLAVDEQVYLDDQPLLAELQPWLRYRLSRWTAGHPVTAGR